MPRNDASNSFDLRIGELDRARGLGMLLVIGGHALEPIFLPAQGPLSGTAFVIWRTIYAFHMPLLFLIAGAAESTKPRRSLREALSGAIALVAVAVAFNVFGAILVVAMGKHRPDDVLLGLLAGQFTLSPLWFLVALALARSIDACADAVAHPALGAAIILGAVAASYACSRLGIVTWQAHTVFGALPFYLAGRRVRHAGLRPSALAGACGLVALLCLSSTNLVHMASGLYGDVPTFLAAALGGCCFTLAVSRGLADGPLSRPLSHLGRRSFDLFIVNGLFLAVVPSFSASELSCWAGLAICAGVSLQLALAGYLHDPLWVLRKTVTDRALHVLSALSVPASAPRT